MKFLKKVDKIPEGGEIPDGLIDKVSKGKVTFISGAGVSRRIGFPSFRQLTEQVYNEIGENIESINTENTAFEKGEYDRALGLLENRIRFPGRRTKVRETITILLSKSKNKVLGSHIDLLNLSRDPKGRVRIGTTNFDNLFEIAAQDQGIKCAPSHVLSATSKPGAENDHGIIHLHGRIHDKTIGLQESDLILTSADFGEAYMREGWVPLYLEDRLREGTIVLVGYGAEDAAMRILLDAIESVRIRLSDINEIYALDVIEGPSSEIWESKGIKLIGFENHDYLYDSLNEWAKYNSNPLEYIKKDLARIFYKIQYSKKSSFFEFRNVVNNELVDYEFKKLKFYSDRIGLAEFKCIISNPSSYLNIPNFKSTPNIQSKLILLNWILFFVDLNYNIGTKLLVDRLFDSRLSLDDINNIPYNFLNEIDLKFVTKLEKHIQYEQNLDPVVKKCLELYIYEIQYNRLNHSVKEWNELVDAIDGKELPDDMIDKLIEYLFMGIRLNVGKSLPSDTENMTPAEIFDIRLARHRYILRNLFFSKWNEDPNKNNNSRFLNRFTKVLEHTLKLAESVGLCGGHGEVAYSTDSSEPKVIARKQENFLDELYNFMVEATRLWDDLANLDKLVAISILSDWADCKYSPIYWGALYGAKNSFVPSDIAYGLLSKIQDYEFYFWPTRGVVRELVKNRLEELPEEQKTKIEDKIFNGIPEYHFTEDRKNWVKSFQFEFLDYMKKSSISFGPKLSKLYRELKGKEQDLGKYIEEIRKLEPKIKFMSEDELEQIVHKKGKLDEKISEILSQRFIIKPEYIKDWENICKKYPERALLGLEIHLDSDVHNRNCWIKFFKFVNWTNNKTILNKTMKTVNGLDKTKFPNLSFEISEWLKSNIDSISSSNRNFWGIISWFEGKTPIHPGLSYVEQKNDLEVQSWVGNLADIFGSILSKSKNVNQKKIDFILESIKRFWKLENKDGDIFKVRLTSYLPILFEFYPKFIKNQLIPLFIYQNQQSEECWEAFAECTEFIPEELFVSLKEAFLRTLQNNKLKKSVISSFVRKLVRVAVTNKLGQTNYIISYMEIRGVIRDVGAKYLFDVVEVFQDFLKEKNMKDKGKFWKKNLESVFLGIWPLDYELHKEGWANSSLIKLVSETGESISEVATLVEPYLCYNEKEFSESVSALSSLNEKQLESAPILVLEMMLNVIGKNPQKHYSELNEILEKVQKVNPEITDQKVYQQILVTINNIPN